MKNTIKILLILYEDLPTDCRSHSLLRIQRRRKEEITT